MDQSKYKTHFHSLLALYRSRGFALCRVEPGQKRPVYKDWTRKSLEPDAFTPGSNVGLLCGPLSDDLVCVDLDSPEALSTADDFLPFTAMIDGRPGKPRSHRWYRVTNIPPEHTSTAAGGIGGPKLRHFAGILDFVGTGGQAVVPPSLHASGEQRFWYGEDGSPVNEPGEPTTLDFTTLWEAVCALAKACGWEEKPARNADKAGTRQEQPAAWESVPMAERVARCRLYLLHADPAVSGNGGHDRAFQTARLIMNDFAVDDWASALALFQEYNCSCQPPWNIDELEHKLSDAIAAPLDPRFLKGCKLTEQLPASCEAVDDPHRLARAFLRERYWRGNFPSLLFWQGAFWAWNGQAYRDIPEETIKGQLNGFIKAEFDRFARRQRQQAERKRAELQAIGEEAKAAKVKPTPKVTALVVNNALLALKGEQCCLLDHEAKQPGWIGDKRRSYLAMANGLIDLNALLRAEPTAVVPHSPLWFSSVCLPYQFDPAKRCPGWLSVVGRILEDDAERLALLQEWFGYCLLPTTDQQKFLMMLGEGSNGKSVVCGALTAVLGEENVSAVPLEAFGSNFGLYPTIGKLANISAEIGDLDKAAEGMLKSYVDGSAMTLDRKHRDPITARPTARLTFATNNLPRFHDRSNGIWRRLILMPFRVCIPESERVSGMDKPAYWRDELPGMFNWSVEGLRRLLAHGRFTMSAVCAAEVARYRAECNPAHLFLEESCEVAAEGWITCGELYRAYRNWCADNGYQALAANKFGGEVKRKYGVAKSRPRADGGRVGVYVGLNMRRPDPAPVERKTAGGTVLRPVS